MGVKRTGASHDPFIGYRFRTMVNGQFQGWNTLSGIEWETEVNDYAEGIDEGHMNKVPGLTTNPPIVVGEGMSTDDFLEKWYEKVYDYDAVNQVDTPNFRETLTIQIMQGKTNAVAKEYNAYESWINKLSIDELNAQDGKVLMRSAEFVHEGLKRMV